MTRINLISVQELTDQHLLAEHRELKRIPSMIQKGKVILAGIPKEFCLGKGHVKFFYNKLGFLQKRYLEIFAECKKRGFEVENYSGNFIGINKELFGDFEPTKDDIELSRQRIIQKLEAKPGFYKYYGKNIIDITFIMIILILLL